MVSRVGLLWAASLNRGSDLGSTTRAGSADSAIESPLARIAARSNAFSRSRTLPGHEYFSIASSASGVSPFGASPRISPVLLRNSSERNAMSFGRSRGGGGPWLGSSSRNDFPLLQDAKGLHLGSGRGLADFVEEEGAIAGRREEPILVTRRTSEGSFHVAEQLAFEKALRQRAAVDGKKWLASARRLVVDVARHDFLACPGLSLQENGRIRTGDRFGDVQGVHPGLARPHRSARSILLSGFRLE